MYFNVTCISTDVFLRYYDNSLNIKYLFLDITEVLHMCNRVVICLPIILLLVK